MNQAERVQALADISRSVLCCHGNETGAPIANPPNSAQLEGTPTIPPTYIRVCMWACGEGQTDTHRQMHVTNIHFASSATQSKCNECRWRLGALSSVARTYSFAAFGLAAGVGLHSDSWHIAADVNRCKRLNPCEPDDRMTRLCATSVVTRLVVLGNYRQLCKYCTCTLCSEKRLLFTCIDLRKLTKFEWN